MPRVDISMDESYAPTFQVKPEGSFVVPQVQLDKWAQAELLYNECLEEMNEYLQRDQEKEREERNREAEKQDEEITAMVNEVFGK